MSREINNDFKELKDFIEKYSIKHLSDENNFKTLLSQQHKKLFSYLTFVAELNFQISETKRQKRITQEQIDYLTESCSDIGNAMFLTIHGAYKASRMMLRSSIETFHKGFNLDDFPEITTTKSLFEIFDKVKALPFFTNEPLKSAENKIHSYYAELCRDTHTAKLENMQQTIGLKYFPAYSEDETKENSKILLDLVSNYLTCLSFKYKDYLISMHHRNRENIIENISNSIKPILFAE
jgi:hypothetical protein